MTDQPARPTPDDRELDALDGLVDQVLGGEAGVPVADGSADLAETVLRVRALSDEPLPAASRDRHLVTIRTHGPVATPRQTVAPRHVRRRLVAVTSAAALLLVSGGGAVAAAQDAQPDDALYGLKRTSEKVWLVVPRGPASSADVHLTLAERRIEEARRAPDHAAQLVAEGIENVEAAAEERPEEAIESFERLLGEGPDRLPDHASPAARASLHRNCVRIAERRGLATDRCGEAPEFEHPGRGQGRGQGVGPGASRGQGRGLGRGAEDGPRGWGPGGRPDGAVGPPPGTPGHGRGAGGGADAEDAEADDAVA